MPQAAAAKDKQVRYRRRLREAGGLEVLVQLPRETVELLDDLKQRGGLRNRSQALLQLIQQGRGHAQQGA
jgi:hypothetical protein